MSEHERLLEAKIQRRDEQIAKLHSTAMNLIAETAVCVSSDTTVCGYCNAFDNPGEGEVPDFLHMGYCPVGKLKKIIKEWRDE